MRIKNQLILIIILIFFISYSSACEEWDWYVSNDCNYEGCKVYICAYDDWKQIGRYNQSTNIHYRSVNRGNIVTDNAWIQFSGYSVFNLTINTEDNYTLFFDFYNYTIHDLNGFVERQVTNGSWINADYLFTEIEYEGHNLYGLNVHLLNRSYVYRIYVQYPIRHVDSYYPIPFVFCGGLESWNKTYTIENGICTKPWLSENYSKYVVISVTNDDVVSHNEELIGYPYGISIENITIYSDASAELRLIDDETQTEIKNFDIWGYTTGQNNAVANITWVNKFNLSVNETKNVTLWYDNNTVVTAPTYADKFIGQYEHCDGSSIKDGIPENWSVGYENIMANGDGRCIDKKTGDDLQRTVSIPLNTANFISVVKHMNYTGCGARTVYGCGHTSGYSCGCVIMNSTYVNCNYIDTNNKGANMVFDFNNWNTFTFTGSPSYKCGYLNGQLINTCLSMYQSNVVNFLGAYHYDYPTRNYYLDDFVLYFKQQIYLGLEYGDNSSNISLTFTSTSSTTTSSTTTSSTTTSSTTTSSTTTSLGGFPSTLTTMSYPTTSVNNLFEFMEEDSKTDKISGGMNFFMFIIDSLWRIFPIIFIGILFLSFMTIIKNFLGLWSK